MTRRKPDEPVPAKKAVKGAGGGGGGAGGAGGGGSGGGKGKRKGAEVVLRDETPSRFGGVLSGVDVLDCLQVSSFSFDHRIYFLFANKCT
jgi:hypothetical protein